MSKIFGMANTRKSDPKIVKNVPYFAKNPQLNDPHWFQGFSGRPVQTKSEYPPPPRIAECEKNVELG